MEKIFDTKYVRTKSGMTKLLTFDELMTAATLTGDPSDWIKQAFPNSNNHSVFLLEESLGEMTIYLVIIDPSKVPTEEDLNV